MKEPTPLLSVLLILAAACFGAFGSFLYKTGAQGARQSGRVLWAEPRLWGGVACYLLVMVCFISAFRNGGALTVLYPVYASTFMVSALISLVAFGIPILPVNAAGMALLVGGILVLDGNLKMKTTTMEYSSGRARRPLKARTLPGWKELAGALVRRGLRPNTVSVAGLAAGVGSGVCLAATGAAGGDHVIFLVAALLLIVLRGVCNILDGVMAVEAGAATRVGALYNEVPDRLSDAATLIGAGYAAGSHPVLGWAAALGAVFTAYVRVECHGAGAAPDYRGFFGKPGRMVVLAVCLGMMLLLPGGARFEWAAAPLPPMGILGWGLVLITGGSIVTAAGRLRRAARELRNAS